MEHEQWTHLQDRVLARLPEEVPPTNEEEWKAFHKRVLAHPLLRPALQPEGPEERALFLEYILEQFLVRCWCDSVCVSLIIADKWLEFENQLAIHLRPLTIEDMEVEYTVLRCRYRGWETIDEFVAEARQGEEKSTNFLLHNEVKRVLWDKQIALRIASQEQSGQRRAERTKSAREPSEADPASRPELLLAVQIGTEDEKQKETRWRADIIPYLPVALRPTSAPQWMQLDCRVLAQMSLQPRLDVAGEVTDSWQAKERQWEEWEKLTALKLLDRRWVEEEGPGSPMHPPRITQASKDGWKRRHQWKKRIIAQMPPNVRPGSLDDWMVLRIKFRNMEASDRLEDWENMIVWMLEADNIAEDEESRQQDKLMYETYASELEEEARRRASQPRRSARISCKRAEQISTALMQSTRPHAG